MVTGWLMSRMNPGAPKYTCSPIRAQAGRWQISTEGGTEPAWNHNGKELFYRTGNKMMALDVATQPGFVVGKPHMLFEGAVRYERLAAGKHGLMTCPRTVNGS